MAASIRSLGMFTALAFWIAVRKRALFSGRGPPSLTAIAISFPKRVNWTAILAQRLNFLSFLNSKALPIVYACLFLRLSIMSFVIVGRSNVKDQFQSLRAYSSLMLCGHESAIAWRGSPSM